MSKSTMSKTAMILAAGLTLAVPAAAETLKPLQGASLDFGDVTVKQRGMLTPDRRPKLTPWMDVS